MFGPRTAQSKLVREVATQRPGDEEQSLAILDRFTELPVRAGEEWWAPDFEPVRLEPARSQHRVPAIATQLAFQLARTDRSNRA